MSSFPNRRPNARGDMLPLAVEAYAENRVYFPNEECAPSACTTGWSSGAICLLLEVANKAPVRNFNCGPSATPKFVFRSFYRLRKASRSSGSARFEFLLFRRYFYHQYFWKSPKNSPRTMPSMGRRMVGGDEKKNRFVFRSFYHLRKVVWLQCAV